MLDMVTWVLITLGVLVFHALLFAVVCGYGADKSKFLEFILMDADSMPLLCVGFLGLPIWYMLWKDHLKEQQAEVARLERAEAELRQQRIEVAARSDLNDHIQRWRDYSSVMAVQERGGGDLNRFRGLRGREGWEIITSEITPQESAAWARSLRNGELAFPAGSGPDEFNGLWGSVTPEIIHHATDPAAQERILLGYEEGIYLYPRDGVSNPSPSIDTEESYSNYSSWFKESVLKEKKDE